MNLTIIHEFMIRHLQNDATGHDVLHIDRVEKIAERIARAEGIDEYGLQIIRAAVYLHDVIDEKVTHSVEQTIDDVRHVLKSAEAHDEEIEIIMDIILNMSYSKNIEQKKTLTHLGQIVQDADRIDALGAIGIARTFYYAGSKGSAIYDATPPIPADELTESKYRQNTSAINHFYEKLLLLKDTMNTVTGKKLADERTELMKHFLTSFDAEISGEC